MNRVTSMVLAKGVELLLLAALVKAFGSVRTLDDAWKIFCGMPELSQIGTIACVAVSFGVLAATLVAIYEWMRDQITRMVSRFT